MSKNKRNIVVVNCILLIVLLIMRMIISKSIVYSFLVWNIFLAIIPWFISSRLYRKHKEWNSKIRVALLISFWLLFFPNAPYIITDLFHLDNKNNIPLWYDLILLLEAGWIGLLLSFYSIKQIEDVLHYYWGKMCSKLFIISFIFISSFGIYLGRYLRWNSWDIILRPGFFIKDTVARVIQPSTHFEPWSMTIIFGLFFCGLYWTVNFSNVNKSRSNE